VGLLTAGFRGTPEERPTEAIDRLTQVLIELCARGGWSAHARQCFLTVDSLAATTAWDACAGMLTVEQRDAFPRAIDAAFGPRTAPAAP
jgi:hypothetical protein